MLSDLHSEFAPFTPPSVEADIVVLAGDIGVGERGVRWAAASFPGMPVVYVPGNHEYYGGAIPKLTDKLRALGLALGVHVLDRDAVEIGDVRFLGCTLWTDFTLNGDERAGITAAREQMVDYRRIRVSPEYRRLRPIDTLAWHCAAMRWPRRELDADEKRTVVVTHHAPSRASPVSLRAHPLSAAYASARDELVASSGAALWIHGHTHCCADYKLGRTRVISNQRGYHPDESVEGFDPRLVVTI